MTDAALDPATFSGDEELVFDEPDPAPKRRRRKPVTSDATDGPGDTPAPTAAIQEPAAIPQPGDAAAASTPRAARLMLGGAFALSCLASFASLGATISIGRGLGAVADRHAEASEERAALARVPALAAALEAAVAKQPIREQSSSQPATANDLRRAIDGLRLAIAERRPDGLAPLTGTTRAGFNELGQRLDRIEARLDALSAGRRASREPYRAPPS